MKNSTEAEIKLFGEITPGGVFLTLPVKTVSEANCFEHWSKKSRRHKLQQSKVALALKPIRNHVKLPCSIKLTRFASRKLDKHDNLPMSLKYIVDAICAIITGDYRAGKADDNEEISISYDQVQSKISYVTVLIENSSLEVA